MLVTSFPASSQALGFSGKPEKPPAAQANEGQGLFKPLKERFYVERQPNGDYQVTDEVSQKHRRANLALNNMLWIFSSLNVSGAMVRRVLRFFLG